MTDANSPIQLGFTQGAKDGAPYLLVILPFAMLFGVVATEAGLNIAQTMGFSVLVIAGASQFAAIAQIQDNAPVLIALATSLAVNLRMAMYSAALVPHLGKATLLKRAFIAYTLVDQTGVVATERFNQNPDQPMQKKFIYIIGFMTPIAPFWYGGTLFGAIVGAQIPDVIPLDFAMPITFLAMIAPMVRTRAHLAAAVTSVIVALLLNWMPFSTGLLIAGVAAMAVGAWVEIIGERRAT